MESYFQLSWVWDSASWFATQLNRPYYTARFTKNHPSRVTDLTAWTACMDTSISSVAPATLAWTGYDRGGRFHPWGTKQVTKNEREKWKPIEPWDFVWTIWNPWFTGKGYRFKSIRAMHVFLRTFDPPHRLARPNIPSLWTEQSLLSITACESQRALVFLLLLTKVLKDCQWGRRYQKSRHTHLNDLRHWIPVLNHNYRLSYCSLCPAGRGPLVSPPVLYETFPKLSSTA